MKLQRREKILVWVTGGLVGVAALGLLFVLGDSRSTAQLQADHDKLISEIDGKQKVLQAAARDAKRLADWQLRSLPSDPMTARSLYQDWLRGLANRVSFRGETISSSDAGARRDQFTRISFTLRARTNLGDLVAFLYEFYSAGYLHQIRKMDVKPIQESRDLDVNMTIEAMSLPGASSKSEMPKVTGHGLRLPKLSDYRGPLVARNPFVAYVPPAVAARRQRTVAPADYTFVTALVEVDGIQKVWLQDRIANKLWTLAVGDEFEVGKVQGKVVELSLDGWALLDYDGHRRRLRAGDTLHGGVSVPAKVSTEANSDAEGPNPSH
jgi:hypothetical protein